MREDLNKQLCEHERYGSKNRYKQYRGKKTFSPKQGTEGENVPMRESMKYRYGYNQKEFSENLNPLYGSVRKAVGQKWDSFYSELCKTFDKRSVINQHIIQHLFQFIETKNVYVGNDGQLYVARNYYNGGAELLSESSVEYYVDPRDGIIKKNEHRKTYRAIQRERKAKNEAEAAALFREIDKDNVLRFIDGVWYHFEMKDIPLGSMTYVAPLHTKVFQTGYAALGRGIIEKTWDELNSDERARFGRMKLVGKIVMDAFTREAITWDGKKTHGHSWATGSLAGATKYFNIGRYHATKQTASRKLLKKAGIV